MVGNLALGTRDHRNAQSRLLELRSAALRDPSGDTLIYYNSLADPRQLNFTAWVEPPGWQPVWVRDDERGYYFLDNEPKLCFQFRRGWFTNSGTVDRPSKFAA